MLAWISQAAFYLVHYLPCEEISQALAVFVQEEQQPTVKIYSRFISKFYPVLLRNCFHSSR